MLQSFCIYDTNNVLHQYAFKIEDISNKPIKNILYEIGSSENKKSIDEISKILNTNSSYIANVIDFLQSNKLDTSSFKVENIMAIRSHKFEARNSYSVYYSQVSGIRYSPNINALFKLVNKTSKKLSKSDKKEANKQEQKALKARSPKYALNSATIDYKAEFLDMLRDAIIKGL